MNFDQNFYADLEQEQELELRVIALNELYPNETSRIDRASKGGHKFLDAFERNMTRQTNGKPTIKSNVQVSGDKELNTELYVNDVY